MAKPRRRLAVTEPGEVLTLAHRLLEPIKAYWKWVLAGTLAGTLALGAWGITGALKARKEAQAAAALAEINLKAPEALVLERLEKVIREYPGAAAAREADLLRANLLYRKNNFAEAARAYESLQAMDPGLAPFLAETLSYCYEALGDFKKAAAVLKPAADQITGPFQGEVWRRLAYLYEQAGEPRDAAAYWQKLLQQQKPAPGLVPYLKEKLAGAEAAK